MKKMEETEIFKPLEKCGCLYCRKYGDGTLWYLNPKNYSSEKAKELGITGKAFIGTRTEAHRSMYKELGFKLESRLHGPKLREIIEKEKIALQQGPHALASVSTYVPIEEAREILRIADRVVGRGFLTKHCDCSMAVHGKCAPGCLIFSSTYIENVWKNFKDTEKFLGAKLLSIEAAMDYLEKMEKKGYMILVGEGNGYIELFCFCELSRCEELQHRMYYGLTPLRYKGHYVAFQDPDRCVGCGKCVIKCQFHAITYDITRDRASFDMWKCFGCGVCRQACDHDAIKLVPRVEFPPLAEGVVA